MAAGSVEQLTYQNKCLAYIVVNRFRKDIEITPSLVELYLHSNSAAYNVSSTTKPQKAFMLQKSWSTQAEKNSQLLLRSTWYPESMEYDRQFYLTLPVPTPPSH